MSLVDLSLLNDQSEIQEGGGDREPLEAGRHRVRMFAYVELGKEAPGPQFPDAKSRDKVLFGFETFPKGGGEGRQAWVTLSMSFSSKSKYPLNFARLNHDQKLKHAVQAALELRPYILDVKHQPSKRDPNKTVAVLMENGILNLTPAIRYDENDEAVPLNVPAATQKPVVFLWNQANADQLATLAGKDWIIERIKKAENYAGSRAQALIEGGDLLTHAEKPAKTAIPAQDDADFE